MKTPGKGWERVKVGADVPVIPMEKWGKDHWSTLGYFETLEVDKNGEIDNRRMRCNARMHREMVGWGPGSVMGDGSEYPTRLRGGEKQSTHDDWSCAEDMIAHGLIEMWFLWSDRARLRIGPFGYVRAKVRLTPKGREIAYRLREHKAAGGTFSTFEG